jgi:SAM-dependent methyltransferase
MLDAYAQWKGWDEANFGRFTDNDRRYFEWHVRRALRGREPQRVLEIGFGNGSFLGFGRARGWDIIGVEISSELRARAERAGYRTVADIDLLAPDAGFDLVALFDVLEHLEADQLIGFVRKLRALLVPSGAILLRVPNGDSPFGRRHQHGDMTHRVAIGEMMLRQIAAASDLQVGALGESPWKAQQFEPPGWQAFWRYRVRKLVNRLVAFAYYYTRTPVDLSPNLAAVLRPRDAQP